MYGSAAVLHNVLQAGCMSNLSCSSGCPQHQKYQVPYGLIELAGGFADVQLGH